MVVRVLFLLSTVFSVSLSQFCDDSKLPNYDVSSPHKKYPMLGCVEMKKKYILISFRYSDNKFELS